MEKPSESPRKKQDLEGLAHGLQFALTAILGMAVGYWLDKRFLPSPLGTIGGFMLGAALGMYTLARALNKKK